MFLHWWNDMGECMKRIRGNDESRADGKQCPWIGAEHPIHFNKAGRKRAKNSCDRLIDLLGKVK